MESKQHTKHEMAFGNGNLALHRAWRVQRFVAIISFGGRHGRCYLQSLLLVSWRKQSRKLRM